MKILGTLALSLALAAPPAGAQAVTRLDLARAVAKLDQLLAGGDFTPEELRATSAAFDRVSLAFLGGNLRGALADLERLRLELMGPHEDATLDELLAPASVRVAPAAPWGDGTVDVVVEPLFAVPALAGREIPVSLRDVTEDDCFLTGGASGTLRFDEEGFAEPFRWPALALASEGDPRALLALAPGVTISARPPAVALYTWLERSPAETRALIVPDLDLFARPGTETACRVLAARTELLLDEPSPERSHEFLVDPRELGQALLGEMAALHLGDPYVERPGHLWRPVFRRRRELPVRLYAPESIVDRDEPVPLVVAFHGAGADESFFVELRGMFDLVGMADEREFLLVCPRTPDWFYDAKAFTALVDEMDRCYGVDRARVYALGHSMGAGCVGSLLKAGAMPLAGAAFLAGAGDPGEREDVPLLFVAGERDPLIPPARVRAAAESHSGDFVEVPGLGHTFVLGPGLALALDAFGLTAPEQK